jgi:hypothetical protein
MKNKYTIEPPFVQHRLVMLESAAWRSLNDAAKKLLDRLEVELMRQWTGGEGNKNGALVCTYQDFFSYGIRRSSIPGAIQLATGSGLLEVTQQGRFIGNRKWPSQYRLTYLPTKDAAPTDEWRKASGNGQVVNAANTIFLRTRKRVLTGSENAPCTGCENGTPVEPRYRVRKRDSF